MPGFVHIVDDDPSFLKAMERRLRQAGYEVATYPAALHFLVSLPNESVPSCIILDVRIPDLDGPALQKRLAELGSTLPIIFLTGYPDIPTTVQTIKAGAVDFLTKPINSHDLIRAIEIACAHHKKLRDLIDKLNGVRARIGTLTPRERQVFDLAVGGITNKEIGRTLGATERTIKAHRKRVMVKMQVQSLAELVSLAERAGVASVAGQTAYPASHVCDISDATEIDMFRCPGLAPFGSVGTNRRCPGAKPTCQLIIWTSGVGTNRTNRTGPAMSVYRGELEVIRRGSEPTRLMRWTTPAPGIECAKWVIVEQRITGGGRPHAC